MANSTIKLARAAPEPELAMDLLMADAVLQSGSELRGSAGCRLGVVPVQRVARRARPAPREGPVGHAVNRCGSCRRRGASATFTEQRRQAGVPVVLYGAAAEALEVLDVSQDDLVGGRDPLEGKRDRTADGEVH